MNDIIPRGQAAVDARAQAATARAEAASAQLELTRQMDAAKADLRRQRDELDRQHRAAMQELEARMAPLKAELERLQEVAWTIDLYLGRDEHVELLRDGSPAPADTPLVVRSSVLFADEESLLLVEHGGVDFRTVDAFLHWLVAAPENLDRVVPDQRCIVAVKPSRQGRDYGDPWMANYARQANERAHWIVRNGERVYLLVTGVDLPIGNRITPKQDEFTAMFTVKGVPLEPGSDAWVQAEKRAEARQRHFMRLMLVIQGLVDRSVCLRPLPDSGVNVMSMAAHDSGQVVLLDEDRLALTDGRPSFRAWQKSLNGRLRSGVRVVLATGSKAFRSDNDTHDSNGRNQYRNQRITPERCGSLPASGEPHLIESAKDGRFTIRFARTDEVWRRDVYRGEHPVVPSKRASLWFTGDESWVLPFDLASRDDLVYYLNRRSDRQNYLDMVPVLRAAIAAKDAEATAEAGFREFLAGRVGEENVDGLVTWWKTAHGTGRPLTGDGPYEAKASAAIIAEHERRAAGAIHAATDAVVVAAARTAIPGLLAVARKGKDYQAYTVTDADRGPWLTIHDLDATGAVTVVRPWQILSPRTMPTLDILYATEQWALHPLRPNVSAALTGPELDALCEQMRTALTKRGATPIAVVAGFTSEWSNSPRTRMFAYGWKADADLSDGDRRVDDQLLCLVGPWKRTKDSVTFDGVRPWTRSWGTYSDSFDDPGRPWPSLEEAGEPLLHGREVGRVGVVR